MNIVRMLKLSFVLFAVETYLLCMPIVDAVSWPGTVEKLFFG